MLNLQASLLCDYATRDEHGKVILIGIFSNFQSATFPLKIPRFYIFNAWLGKPGKHSLDVKILSPQKDEAIFDLSKKNDGKPLDIILEKEKFSVQVAIEVNNLEFKQSGTFWLRYIIDGEPFEIDFPVPVIDLKLQTKGE